MDFDSFYLTSVIQRNRLLLFTASEKGSGDNRKLPKVTHHVSPRLIIIHLHQSLSECDRFNLELSKFSVFGLIFFVAKRISLVQEQSNQSLKSKTN